MRTFLAAAMLLATTSIAPAQQQQQCYRWDELKAKLGEDYKAQELWGGIIGNKPNGGDASLVILGDRNGHWGAYVIDGQNKACAIAEGQGWYSIPLLLGDAI